MTTSDERHAILSDIAGRTIPDLLDANAREFADDAALESMAAGGNWERLTWGEYAERVGALASALVETGLAPGDRVVILAGNRPEHVITDLAVLTAGGVPVSLYPTLAPEQRAYIVRDADAAIAVVTRADLLRADGGDSFSGVRHVIVLDGDPVELESIRVETWTDALARGRAGDHAAVRARRAAADPADPATIIYTSGTTGVPKGVVLTHANVLFMLESLSYVTDFAAGYVNISYLPLAHIAERLFSHYIGLLRHGHTYFAAEQTDLLPTLIAARPDAFLGVPRVWEKLLAGVSAALPAPVDTLDEGVRAAVRAMIGLDRCAFCVSGSAPIAVDVLEFWAALGLPIHEAYGMTETTGVTNINRPGEQVFGTVGRALPGVEVRVLDDGEIVARGPNLMAGYLNHPDDTAATYDDEWLRTGDLGEVDAEGRLRIVGRKKELIVTAGGKNVAPAPIEARVKEHPLVGQLCVVGDRRPYITALVVLDPDGAAQWAAAHDATGASIEALAVDDRIVAEVAAAVAAANAHFSQAEAIKRFAVLPADWTPDGGELTPTLKLRRAAIQEKYASEIDRLYLGE